MNTTIDNSALAVGSANCVIRIETVRINRFEHCRLVVNNACTSDASATIDLVATPTMEVIN